MANPVESLRVLIAKFLENDANRPALGREIFDLLHHDVQEWWIHCHPNGTARAEGPEYEDFRQKVFNELMTALSVMKDVRAFPYTFITALDGVVLDKPQPDEGALHPPQPSKRRGARPPNCKTTFTNRILVYWYAGLLAPGMRQALELKFIENLTLDEITRRMHFASRSSAEGALTRGVRSIRVYAAREHQGLRPQRTKRTKRAKRTTR